MPQGRWCGREKAAANEVFGAAVERGYFTQNPLNGLRWTAPEVAEEVDPDCVPNPAQVARLLAAVRALPGRGPHLYAFFGCMYYAGMRPAEVIHLQRSQCRLPPNGWGLLNLKGGVVTAGKEWTDNGAVHEIHSLKRRAAKATRAVPIPPVLVSMLRDHMRQFGVAPDGRLFRNAAGKYIDASAYGITWRRPRRVRASGRSKHSGPIPLLRQVSGGSAGSCQPPDRDVHAAMGGTHGGLRGWLNGFWPGNAPQLLVRAGIPVGDIGSKGTFRLAAQVRSGKGT